MCPRFRPQHNSSSRGTQFRPVRASIASRIVDASTRTLGCSNRSEWMPTTEFGTWSVPDVFSSHRRNHERSPSAIVSSLRMSTRSHPTYAAFVGGMGTMVSCVDLGRRAHFVTPHATDKNPVERDLRLPGERLPQAAVGIEELDPVHARTATLRSRAARSPEVRGRRAAPQRPRHRMLRAAQHDLERDPRSGAVATDEVRAVWLHRTHLADVVSGHVLDPLRGRLLAVEASRLQAVQRLVGSELIAEMCELEDADQVGPDIEQWRALAAWRDGNE